MGEGTGPIWNLGTGPRRVGWGLTALRGGGGALPAFDRWVCHPWKKGTSWLGRAGISVPVLELKC